MKAASSGNNEYSLPQMILSLKGGGVKGMVQLVALAKIEELTVKRIYELYDMIVGTSVGGIIAAGLTYVQPNMHYPKSAEEIQEFFMDLSQDIFPRYSLRKLYSCSGLFTNKYDETNLRNKLVDYFSRDTLNAIKTPVGIVVATPQEYTPLKVISNQQNICAADYQIVEVLLATSAAPGYFPGMRLNSHDTANVSHFCIDGGIGANNPSALMLQVLKSSISEDGKCTSGSECAKRIETMELHYIAPLTIRDVSDPETTWCSKGLISIAKQVLKGMFSASEYNARNEVNSDVMTYLELNIEIPPKNSALDNSKIKNLEALKNIDSTYINNNRIKFQEIIDSLIKHFNDKHPTDLIDHNNEYKIFFGVEVVDVEAAPLLLGDSFDAHVVTTSTL